MLVLSHASQALPALILGCRVLGKPITLANELLHYLQLRRAQPASVKLSPSSIIDDLWHWMLMNTRTADMVHDVVGGRVEHTTIGSSCAERRMLARMRAMNLLEAQGVQVNLTHWREDQAAGGDVCRYKIYMLSGGAADEPEAGGSMAGSKEGSKAGSKRKKAHEHHHDCKNKNGDKEVIGEMLVYANLSGCPVSYVSALLQDFGYYEPTVRVNDSGPIVLMELYARPPVIRCVEMSGKAVLVRKLLPFYNTVADLKDAYQDLTGVSPQQFRMVVNGAQLDQDHATLADAGVRDEATAVHIVLVLRGC